MSFVRPGPRLQPTGRRALARCRDRHPPEPRTGRVRSGRRIRSDKGRGIVQIGAHVGEARGRPRPPRPPVQAPPMQGARRDTDTAVPPPPASECQMSTSAYPASTSRGEQARSPARAAAGGRRRARFQADSERGEDEHRQRKAAAQSRQPAALDRRIYPRQAVARVTTGSGCPRREDRLGAASGGHAGDGLAQIYPTVEGRRLGATERRPFAAGVCPRRARNPPGSCARRRPPAAARAGLRGFSARDRARGIRAGRHLALGGRGRGTAVLGIVYALPALVVLGLVAAAAVIYPRLTYVSTDLDNPPALSERIRRLRRTRTSPRFRRMPIPTSRQALRPVSWRRVRGRTKTHGGSRLGHRPRRIATGRARGRADRRTEPTGGGCAAPAGEKIQGADFLLRRLPRPRQRLSPARRPPRSFRLSPRPSFSDSRTTSSCGSRRPTTAPRWTCDLPRVSRARPGKMPGGSAASSPISMRRFNRAWTRPALPPLAAARSVQRARRPVAAIHRRRPLGGHDATTDEVFQVRGGRARPRRRASGRARCRCAARSRRSRGRPAQGAPGSPARASFGAPGAHAHRRARRGFRRHGREDRCAPGAPGAARARPCSRPSTRPEAPPRSSPSP